MTGYVRAMIDAMVSHRRVPDEAARVGIGLVRLAVADEDELHDRRFLLMAKICSMAASSEPS